MEAPRVFGPILPWEMTTVVRRSRYFLLRAAYAGALLLCLWYCYETAFVHPYWPQSVLKSSAMFASYFLAGFSVLQLTAVLFLTPAYVAPAITVEKEKKTIEFLFATDLRNQEIVLGKVAARGLNLAVLVLGGLPVLSLATLFGGISVDRLVLLFFVTVATLVSTASVAILVSVGAKQSRQAVGSAYAWIVMLLTIPSTVGVFLPELAQDLTRRWPGGWVVQVLADGILRPLGHFAAWLGGANPYFFTFSITYEALDWNTLLGRSATLLGIHGGVTFLCLTAAILRLRRVYRKDVSKGTPTKVRSRERFHGRRASQDVGDDPVFWREWRGTASPRNRVAQVVFLTFILFWFMWPFVMVPFQLVAPGTFGEPMSGSAMNGYFRFSNVALLGIVLLAVVSRSAVSIATERDRDTWLSLLSTPLTAEEILRGKILGALRPMVWYFGWLFIGGGIAGMQYGLSSMAIPLLGTLALFLAVLTATIGVHQSLFSNGTTRAMSSTVAAVVLLFGLGHLALLIPVSLVRALQVPAVENFFFGGIPIVMIYSAGFQDAVLNTPRAGAGLMGAAVSLAFLAGFGWFLARRAVRRFGVATGRIEG